MIPSFPAANDLICDMDEIKSISFYHSSIDDLVNKNKFLCDIFLVTVSDKINDQLQLKNCMFVTDPFNTTVNDDYLRPTSINGGFCVVRFVSLDPLFAHFCRVPDIQNCLHCSTLQNEATSAIAEP